MEYAYLQFGLCLTVLVTLFCLGWYYRKRNADYFLKEMDYRFFLKYYGLSPKDYEKAKLSFDLDKPNPERLLYSFKPLVPRFWFTREQIEKYGLNHIDPEI